MSKVRKVKSKMERIEKKGEESLNINSLPEGCISDILTLTSPADACRSSLVSTLFQSAANSDVLWEKFLPPDYREIVSRAFSPLSCAPSSTSSVNFNSKKELYYRLCDNPILIDCGLKSFQLEKCSGKKCIMLGARELVIVWGDTPEYWRWLRFPGSRFSEVAELRYVWWFEISGKVETRLLSPETLYGAYLVLKLEGGAYGFKVPFTAKVEVVDGSNSVCCKERRVYLDPNVAEQSSQEQLDEDQYFAQVRGDRWIEVELGDFYNEGGEDSVTGEVHMSVLETKRGEVKSGLIVQGIELRPKIDT